MRRALGVGFPLLLVLACSSKTETPGQLMLSMQTDLSLPKDVDTVRIEVSTFGKVHFGQDYPVGPGGAKIPATLGVVAGSDKTAPVRIRVIAKLGGTSRLLREAVTTVPQNRVASLRLPLQYLSLGQVVESGTGSVGTSSASGGVRVASIGTLDTSGSPGEPVADPVRSTCGEEKTSDNGSCIDVLIDSETLPDYVPADVFGGGDESGGGTCFDTYECLAQGADVEVDLAGCTVAFPADAGAGVNVGLRLGAGKTGICGEAPGSECYVPLDAESASGWTRTAEGRIGLPRPVCQKIQETKDILGVVVTNVCAPKTSAIPPCGPWSGVGGAKASPDGGTPGLKDGGGPISDGGGIVEGGFEDASVVKPWIRIGGADDNVISLVINGDDLYYGASVGRIFKTSVAKAADLDVAGSPAPALYFNPALLQGLPDAGPVTGGEYVELGFGKAVDLDKIVEVPLSLDSILATGRGHQLFALPPVTANSVPSVVARGYLSGGTGPMVSYGLPLGRQEGIYFTSTTDYGGQFYSSLMFCKTGQRCEFPTSASAYPYGKAITAIAVPIAGQASFVTRNGISSCTLMTNDGEYWSCVNYPSAAEVYPTIHSVASDGTNIYFWEYDELRRISATAIASRGASELVYSGKYGSLPGALESIVDAEMQWEADTKNGGGFLYFSSANGVHRLRIDSFGKVAPVETMPWSPGNKRAVALKVTGEYALWTACEQGTAANDKPRCEVYRGLKTEFKVKAQTVDAGTPAADSGTLADSGAAGTDSGVVIMGGN